MLCHDTKGRFFSFNDGQSLINLKKGKITSITPKDSIWSISSDGSKLQIRTDSTLYTVFPLGKDMQFLSINNYTIGILDSLKYRIKHNNIFSNQNYPRQVDIKLKIDNRLLITSFDTISGLMKRTTIFFSNNDRLQLEQSYNEARFLLNRYVHPDKQYAIDIWYNNFGVIDYITSYNLKEGSGFTIWFYGKRKPRRIRQIDYYPNLLDDSEDYINGIYYPMYRYRKSGRLKSHKIEVRFCN